MIYRFLISVDVEVSTDPDEGWHGAPMTSDIVGVLNDSVVYDRIDKALDDSGLELIRIEEPREGTCEPLT